MLLQPGIVVPGSLQRTHTPTLPHTWQCEKVAAEKNPKQSIFKCSGSNHRVWEIVSHSPGASQALLSPDNAHPHTSRMGCSDQGWAHTGDALISPENAEAEPGGEARTYRWFGGRQAAPELIHETESVTANLPPTS